MPADTVDLRTLPRHPDVYEPCDDSFLLVDALTSDLPSLLRSPPSTVLELGCGSGYVSCSLALALRARGVNPLVVGVDINPAATEIARQTFHQHGLSSSAEFITADLLSCFAGRLSGCVDVMLFNPPYVPTPDDEVNKPGITRAWAGGCRGRVVIDRALWQVRRLLSPDGVFYLLLLQENDPEQVRSEMMEFGYECSEVLRRGTEEEALVVLKFVHKHSA